MTKTLTIVSCFLIYLLFACSQLPKPASAPESTEQTASKAGAAFSGPDVDLLKKAYKAYEQGDWATLRAVYSDSAATINNAMATDENVPSTPIDSVIAAHKLARETIYEGMSINNPIYEVVTTEDGSKYGHVWSKLTTKLRKTGETINVTVFGSYGIKDGKLTFEWVIYNQPPVK